MKVNSEIVSKTFVFSQSTDDYKQTNMLTDWGVDDYDAMIAGCDSYILKFQYQLRIDPIGIVIRPGILHIIPLKKCA